MSTPYVGEIRLFAFPRIPQGWMACDGSLQPISEYEVLYTLLGTTYGGDGQRTFGLPDLRGQLPLHQGKLNGNTYVLGQAAGTESVTLLPAQMPAHSHIFTASAAAATDTAPGPASLPAATAQNLYLDKTEGATSINLFTPSTSFTGGTQPHDNTMPTLPLSMCIAWAGIFPSQS